MSPICSPLKMLFAFWAFFAASQWAPCDASAEDTLQIIGIPEDSTVQSFMGGNAWTIYLDGPIDSEAEQRFQSYVIEHKIPNYSFVILNSPGGNLFQGIKLGRLFRQHDFRTDVGISRSVPPKPFEYGPGYCYSACTLAYLGGHFRFLSKGSHYGVHRFSFPVTSANDTDLAQISSAAIVEYLREMKIDSEFFSTMTQASPSEIVEPSVEVLKELNVVNFGFDKPVWTVESRNGLVYLKGQRDTEYGLNKFILGCQRLTEKGLSDFSGL